MNVRLDLSPLKSSKAYRRLFAAGGIATLGQQATYVATAYQLREVTHSTLAVGSLGLVELLPLLAFGLYGGVIADRFNRRNVTVISQIILLLATVLLTLNALGHHQHAWPIYVLDAFLISAGSVQTPSISALNQSLVTHDQQPAAAVLGSIRMTLAAIVGPAVGGLLCVSFGAAWAFFLNDIALVISIAYLLTLRGLPEQPRSEGSHSVLFKEGISYAKTRPDILGTYCIDLLAMAFAYPVIMLPFVAAQFHSRIALSVLYVALPFGALVATLTSGWTKQIHHHGRAVVYAAALWGAGVAVFGYFSNLWIVFLGLAFAGGADAMSAVFRQTMWNQSIPPEVRGRMGGIEMISYALGPMAGQFRSGAMATWSTLRFSLTFGGLASTGSIGAVAVALPALWKYDARTNPYVAEVRRIREAEVAE